MEIKNTKMETTMAALVIMQIVLTTSWLLGLMITPWIVFLPVICWGIIIVVLIIKNNVLLFLEGRKHIERFDKIIIDDFTKRRGYVYFLANRHTHILIIVHETKARTKVLLDILQKEYPEGKFKVLIGLVTKREG